MQIGVKQRGIKPASRWPAPSSAGSTGVAGHHSGKEIVFDDRFADTPKAWATAGGFHVKSKFSSLTSGQTWQYRRPCDRDVTVPLTTFCCGRFLLPDGAPALSRPQTQRGFEPYRCSVSAFVKSSLGFLSSFYRAKAVGDVLDVLNRFWRQCRYQRRICAASREPADRYEYQYGQLMPVQITQMYAGVSGSGGDTRRI